MVEIDFDQALLLALGGLILGIVMLVKGGDWTVDSAVYLAEKIGMSQLVIGFTIIAFGTSLPELIVSLNANFKGSPGIAIGNVLGSNIANVLLVCGAAAIVAPIAFASKQLPLQVYVMLGATLILMGLIVYGEIGRFAGGIMILLLLAYVIYEYRLAKKGKVDVEEVDEPAFKSIWVALFFLITGLVLVAMGAEFMVNSTQLLAQWAGIPEAVIALTIIAFGTSLPELSTCLVAMAKRHGDIVLGNLIGSNVFNILIIIGATALSKPILTDGISDQIANFDIWMTFAVTLAFSCLILFRSQISKTIGIVFCTLYVMYVIGIYGYYMI